MKPSGATLQSDSEARPRRCGRCRTMFEGDATLHPTAQPDWWLCPQCRVVLLGDRRARFADEIVGRR